MPNKKRPSDDQLLDAIRSVGATVAVRAMADVIDEEEMKVSFIFVSDNNRGLRYDWWEGEYFYEEINVAGCRFDNLRTFFKDHKFHTVDAAMGGIHNKRIEDGKLKGDVIFDKDDPEAVKLFRKYANGTLNDVSIGYRVMKITRKTQEKDHDLVIIEECEIDEVSAVGVGFDRGAVKGRAVEATEGESPEQPKPTQEREMPGNTAEEHNNQPQAPGGDTRVGDHNNDAEMKRINAIFDYQTRFNLPAEMVRKAVEGKTSLQDFVAGDVMRHLEGTGAVKKVTTPANLGLNERELKRYSLTNAIRAIITKDFSNAGFEKELSDEVARMNQKEARGIYVPHDIMVVNRTITTATAPGLVPDTHMAGSFIDYLYKKSALSDLVQVLHGLSGSVTIPKQTGQAQTYWVGESGGLTPSDLEIGTINMSGGKTLTGAGSYSRDMLINGNPSIENLVMTDLLKGIALGVDAAALNGSGTNYTPLGVMQTTGVNVIDCSTAAGGLDWAKIVAFESQVAADDADNEMMRYLFNAVMGGLLKTTEKSTGTAKYLMEDNEVNGYGARRSNQVPANSIVFGDFSQIIVGLFGGLDITVDPYTSENGDVKIKAFQSADSAVRYPEAFSVSTNVNQ